MAEPSQNVLNGLQPRLSKLVEIGTIYTTVAGLLNILAIYDAFEGPAYLEAENPGDATQIVSARLRGRSGQGRRFRMTMAPANFYWLVLPLVVAISLVYSASRDESWPRIWIHAVRLCLWILGILIGTTALLLLINTQVYERGAWTRRAFARGPVDSDDCQELRNHQGQELDRLPACPQSLLPVACQQGNHAGCEALAGPPRWWRCAACPEWPDDGPQRRIHVLRGSWPPPPGKAGSEPRRQLPVPLPARRQDKTSGPGRPGRPRRESWRKAAAGPAGEARLTSPPSIRGN